MISELIVITVVGFMQNMAFTWVSRSRNSGAVAYHAVAAVASNGIWFVTFMLLAPMIVAAYNTGDFVAIFITGLVYCASTSAGSCLMMAILLKTEKGKRRVGARQATNFQ